MLKISLQRFKYEGNAICPTTSTLTDPIVSFFDAENCFAAALQSIKILVILHLNLRANIFCLSYVFLSAFLFFVFLSTFLFFN